MAVNIKVTSDSRQAQADLKKLESSLQSVEKSSQQINRSISSFANLAKFAFAALPIAAIGTSAIRTAASFEKLAARLDVVTGSTAKTASALAGIQKIVVTTPFSVQALTDAYARLAATGARVFQSQQQIERAINSIANATAAVGGSNFELQNVARAFERASAEGRITAERLNQLVDAGIPLTRVAKELGLTMEELRQETEKGTFSFERFFFAFQAVAESADGFGGAAARQVNTLNGAFSNLNDALDILFDRAIRQSGVSNLLIRGIIGLTNSINSFSDGIEVSIRIGLNNLTIFYLRSLDILDAVKNSFSNTIDFIQGLIPDLKSLFNSLRVPELDLSFDISEFSLKLADYLPSLESIKKALKSFSDFVINIFFNIYDAVIGNSYWTDLIEGIVDSSDKLLGRVKPSIDRFKEYILNTFYALREQLVILREDIRLQIDISANYGVIKDISDAVKSFTTALETFFNTVKQYTIVKAAFNSVERLFRFLINIQDQINPAVWSSMEAAFNAINVFTREGLGRLIALAGLTKSAESVADTEIGKGIEESAKQSAITFSSIVEDSFNGFIKATSDFVEAIKNSDFAKRLESAANNTSQTFRNGIIFSEQLSAVYQGLGESIGRLIGSAFNDEVQLKIQDILLVAITAVLNKGFRNIVITGIVVDLLIGERTIAEALSGIFEEITKFGNKVLKGAGVPGFIADSSAGGFIGALLVGGLSGALLSSRVRAAIFEVLKQFAGAFVFKRVFGLGDDVAQAEGQAAGAKFGNSIKKGILTVTGIGAAFAGAFIADFVTKELEIESTFAKFFIELGIIMGTIFATNFIVSAAIGLAATKLKALWVGIGQSLLAYLGARKLAAILLAAIIPSGSVVLAKIGVLIATIVGGFSVAALSAALGIVAGVGILGVLLFGDDEGLTGKIRAFVKDSIVEPIRSALLGLLDTIGQKLEGIGTFFKRLILPDPKVPVQGASTLDGFATGGMVRGPGSGTSDSILARLSNGEYVINAKATKENRPLLERINNGLPAFASGGYVGNFIRQQEGFVPRVYHDSLKLLTVGVGHLLNSFDANKLGIPVGKLRTGWTALNEAKTYPNDSYLASKNLRPYNNTELESIFQKDISRKTSIAQSSISTFGQHSKAVQTALIDHVFQLGSFADWPNLVKQVNSFNYFGAIENYLSSLNFRQTPNRVKARIDLYKQGIAERLQKFANGGSVKGPGSGTSDEILARLSNGEFVVNAKATRENLSLLERINAGLPAFQTGGLVSSVNNALSSVGLGNLNIDLSPAAFSELKDIERLVKQVDRFRKEYDRQSIEGGEREETARQALEENTKLLATRLVPFTRGINENIKEIRESQFAQVGRQAGADVRQSVISGVQGILKGQIDFKKFGTQLADAFSSKVIDVFSTQLIESLFKSGGIDKLLESIFTGQAELGDKIGRALSTGAKFITKPLNAIFDPNSTFIEALSSIFKDGSDLFKSAFESIKGFFPGSGGSFNFSSLFSWLPFSSGGYVSGPGSGTSDSILARLSNGEYVVNADATKRNLGLLQAINSGRLPRFAEGGEVGSSTPVPLSSTPAQEASSGFSNDQFNILNEKLSLISNGINNLGAQVTGSANTIVNTIITGLLPIGLGLALIPLTVTLPLMTLINAWGTALAMSNAIGFGFVSTGGYIQGPGTGTSDSIPAMLSNGEYVINAASTKKYRPLLAALNAGILPKFANGGLVGSVNTSATDLSMYSRNNTGKSSSQQVFNINITGDISDQTKKEIYQMLPQIANGVNAYNKEKGIRRS